MSSGLWRGCSERLSAEVGLIQAEEIISTNGNKFDCVSARAWLSECVYILIISVALKVSVLLSAKVVLTQSRRGWQMCEVSRRWQDLTEEEEEVMRRRKKRRGPTSTAHLSNH